MLNIQNKEHLYQMGSNDPHMLAPKYLHTHCTQATTALNLRVLHSTQDP